MNSSPGPSATHDPEMAKTIRWWDGVAITLSLPAALFVGLSYSLGALGGWTALSLWALIAVIAALHNWLYAEMGAMFAHKSGGIALYANEAWRHHLPFLGPLATYAYWFAWATAPAIWGLAVAAILSSQFWPEVHIALSLGPITLDFTQCIALGVALLSWALSMVQLRFTMLLITFAGVLLVIPVILLCSGSFIAPSWTLHHLSWHPPGLRTALAWLFVMAWSAYAVEAAASFIPEYKDTVGDTRKALRISAIFLVLLFSLTPLALTGLLGEKSIIDHPNNFLQMAVTVLFGGGAVLTTLALIAGILVLSVMGTADAGRALYQSAMDGLTVRQFAVLNPAGIPARAITVQLLINVLLVLFVGNALAVIVAGNVGYILAHLIATSGYVVLRKTQPDLPRPIALRKHWCAIAILLALFDGVILLAGMTSAAVTGYGSSNEILIAIGVLAVSQVLYLFRKWQDRAAACGVRI